MREPLGFWISIIPAKLPRSGLRHFLGRMKPKLLVVASHPIQYFAPVYRRISQNGRIDIVVTYLTDAGARPYFDKDFGQTLAWDVELLTGYRHHFLCPGLNTVPKGFFQADFPELPAVLSRESPDAVLIYGYNRRMNWRARDWAHKQHKRVLYCSDSVLLRKRSFWRLVLKRAVLPGFFRGVDVCLSVGDHNDEYYLHYGVTRKQLRRCPLPVDVSRLKAGVAAPPESFREMARREFGFGDADLVALQCGKLSAIKRPFDFMAAVIALRRQGRAIKGFFVGSGKLQELLQAHATESGFAESFHFAGFVNQKDLGRCYAASDVLVMCSESEAHGQVASEAAAFGLPLVVTDQVGCVGPSDVARSGENALVFPCGDIAALTDHLRSLMDSPDSRTVMAAASLRIAETQDVSVAAGSIEAAVLEGAS